ncbi:MAG TPA: (2Fe-2S) ferredoxin domain-containing protein [Chroococcidiopsis sp.]
MSKCHTAPHPEFKLAGRILDLVLKDGYKIKYLRLSAASGEYLIKLSKEARASALGTILKPGGWVQVSGIQMIDGKKGHIEFKAYHVEAIAPGSGEVSVLSAPANVATPAASNPRPGKAATILVCQKSDCCKRGAHRVTDALQAALEQQGLGEQVTIRGTGCMKQCKSAPNLVMPDKTRYGYVSPQDVPKLLAKHFSAPPVASASAPVANSSVANSPVGAIA